MRKNLPRLLAVACSCWLLAWAAQPPARAQAPPAPNCLVRVRYYWGDPAAGVTVELRSGGVAQASGVTNRGGAFLFAAVPAGTYTVGTAPFPNYGVTESPPFTVAGGSPDPILYLTVPPP